MNPATMYCRHCGDDVPASKRNATGLCPNCRLTAEWARAQLAQASQNWAPEEISTWEGIENTQFQPSEQQPCPPNY